VVSDVFAQSPIFATLLPRIGPVCDCTVRTEQNSHVYAENLMPTNLSNMLTPIPTDTGLQALVSAAQMQSGLAAAGRLNTLLLQTISQTHVNDDGIISTADMQTISNAVRNSPASLQSFLTNHGNSNGPALTGFHQVQVRGGVLQFQGHEFTHKVVEGIYNFGSVIVNGSYVNPIEGHPEIVSKVAGWLNYFLNGVNVVHGTDGGDLLDSGGYSNVFAAARNETFFAGAGDDRIWSFEGHDTIFAGSGNDTSGGGTGNDRMYGDSGNDTLYGQENNDRVDGGDGTDTVSGGDGNDIALGGNGDDLVFGDNGNDIVVGQAGNDILYTNEGTDIVRGGLGADTIYLWENNSVRDVVGYYAYDTGTTAATRDVVVGFASGVDDVDLRSLGPMTFRTTNNFAGGGNGSCYYDGQFLRIDHSGDGVTDMMIEFTFLQHMRADDFMFA
jgi:Ca2+-binding RTX toxin-like protein